MLGRLRTLRTHDYRAAPGRLAFSPYGWRDCQWWGVDRRPRHDQRQRHANFRRCSSARPARPPLRLRWTGCCRRSHTVAGADRRHYGGDRAVPHARRTVSSVGRSFRESERNWFILMGDLVVSAVATEGGWLETPESGSRRPTARHAGSGQGGNLPRSAGQPFLDSRIAVVAVPRSTKGGRACASAGG